MIQITQKQDCCGCWACVQRCPKQCITMQEDEEGFLYPHIDLNDCTRCGLCERVCPVLNAAEPREPLAVYAAKNRNEEVRMRSSSGGIFTPLAEAVLEQKGVVFGAKFDADWTVVHGFTETKEGLSAFRGSKYVQSQIGSCYQHAEAFLKTGRPVLFSGTPCQIAGLHRYLMHDYNNLLTVDVVCHGVPSPMIWREYLAAISPIRPDHVRFRQKEGIICRYLVVEQGGKKLCNEASGANIYIQGFLKNLYLRPSCYACAARKGKSGSDITIADYWGIPADMDDDKGIGLVLINTQKGAAAYSTADVESVETPYAQALAGNPCMERSVAIPKYRALFWSAYQSAGIGAIASTCRKMRPSLVRKLLSLAKGVVKQIINRR